MSSPSSSSSPPMKLKIGGAGAAEYMLNVAGDMNAQHRGADGSIAYSAPKGGVGLTESLVPVMLVLANTKISKNWLRNSGLSGKTLKNGLSIGGKHGGGVENPIVAKHIGGSMSDAIVVPASLVRAKKFLGNQLKRTMRSPFMNKTRFSKKHAKSQKRFRKTR